MSTISVRGPCPHRDDPKAVRIVTEKLAAIPECGRNIPAFEVGIVLGSRAPLLTATTFSNFCAAAEQKVGRENVPNFHRGLEKGADAPAWPARLSPAERERRATTAKVNASTRNAAAQRAHHDARQIWEESGPIEGTPAEVYFSTTRGVPVPPGSSVRFHPAAPIFTDRKKRTSPAVVMRFENAATGATVDAVALVYLTSDGRKNTAVAGGKAKLCRGERKDTGGSIRFGTIDDESDTVLLAEGPETLLSGIAAVGLPGLCCFSTAYGSMALPPTVTRAVVLADNEAEATWSKQLDAAREAHPGVEFLVVRCPRRDGDPAGFDFNDLIRRDGVHAVRLLIDNALIAAEGTTRDASEPPPPMSDGVGIEWPECHRSGNPVTRSQPNIRAHLDWRGVALRHDAFAHRDEVRIDGAWRELGDAEVTQLWLDADALGLATSESYYRAVLANEARMRVVHPVREYLAALRWDGVSRVESWLSRYLGVEDTPLTRAYGRLWLMAAVRRVRQPGAKFDQVLVLEGPQGVGKSSALAILGGAWFSDGLEVGAEAQRVLEQTSAVWIVELAELAGLSGREAEQVKSFTSRQSDRARLAYARAPVDRPRQFVLAATTNADFYLRDPTGNRRFWPVRVGGVDLAALRADRDQIWAEVAVMESNGLSLALPDDLWPVATRQQEARVVVHPWADMIMGAIGDRVGKISNAGLWRIVEVDGSRRNPRVGQELAAVMRSLGFREISARRNVAVVRGYSNRPDGEGNGGGWLDDLIGEPAR